MTILEKDKLIKINGGSISFGAILGFGALITFFIGLIDGYIRPLACKS